MRADTTPPNPGPTPERLAAFADGELHGCDRAKVEAYVAACPRAAVEVEAFRQLASMCQATTAPEPSPEAWAATLARVQAALPSVREPRPARRPARRVWRPAIAAAAVLFLSLLSYAMWPARVVSSEGPLDLADAGDVFIICMDADDVEHLLIGQPPVCGALVLAGPDDVTLVHVEPVDGVVPGMRQDGAAPMRVPPVPVDAP